jgi:ferric-dicitrate binding protein FerR (iron transport regulator)
MNKEQAQELLEKYRLGICTPEEKTLLERWYLEESARQPMPDAPADPAKEEQIIWNRVLETLPAEPQIRRLKKWYSIATAAAILIFLSVGLYFVVNKPAQQQIASNQLHKNDIAPGGNKAILTLADGKKIILTGARNGLLATQSNTEIKKTEDGKITYTTDQSLSGKLSAELQYNTITTPRGGQYQVTLPDGTRVFLNAASSLVYPTAFVGSERKVTLTGEAYFEVAHNAHQPFRVSSNGQIVEVLGTHFNINDYSDERLIKTTLLEGSVRISHGQKTAILKPGQQTQISNNDTDSDISIIPDADIEEAVAWKNGLFILDGHIQPVMRMISRWYDVDVVYDGPVPDDTFGGEVPRFQNISEVLKVLQLTKKVHFKIENRRIIVSK